MEEYGSGARGKGSSAEVWTAGEGAIAGETIQGDLRSVAGFRGAEKSDERAT